MPHVRLGPRGGELTSTEVGMLSSRILDPAAVSISNTLRLSAAIRGRTYFCEFGKICEFENMPFATHLVTATFRTEHFFRRPNS